MRNRILLLGALAAQLIPVGALYTLWIKDVPGIQPVSVGHWFQLPGMAPAVTVVRTASALPVLVRAHQDRILLPARESRFLMARAMTRLIMNSLSLLKTGSLLYLLGCALLSPAVVFAEEQSVRPGINRYYANPDWDQWVNTFERSGREVYDKRYAIVDASGAGPGMVVADIGAGTGLFTRLFADRVGPGGRVYAVDISQPFVENIVRTAREQGLDNVEGIVNSARDVSLPPASIDLAFLVDTYHHFEYPASMLSSIRQALRDGGTLIVIDFRRNPSFSSRWVMGHVRAGRETVIDEVTRAGFQLVDDKPLLRTNYYLVFSKPVS